MHDFAFAMSELPDDIVNSAVRHGDIDPVVVASSHTHIGHRTVLGHILYKATLRGVEKRELHNARRLFQPRLRFFCAVRRDLDDDGKNGLQRRADRAQETRELASKTALGVRSLPTPHTYRSFYQSNMTERAQSEYQ